MVSELSESAQRVLRVLASRAMDGYTLRSRTKLTPDNLTSALEELVNRSLVVVKGELVPDSVGEAYLTVTREAKGYLQYVLLQKRVLF